MFTTNENGILQKPLESGFDAASTAQEVINGIYLTGKTAVVTGGYAGIGLETVKALANAGAKVIIPAKDIEKAAQNLKGISNITIEAMDLMDPVSIDIFVEKFLAANNSLDLLINNAGIMWFPLVRDSRGYESHFSTNHLGHFQLTAGLWNALKNAENARVINVSSWGHHFSDIVFDDVNFENREYDERGLAGYGQSKTANILFSLELDKRGSKYGVRSFSLHPGAIVETDLKRRLNDNDLKDLGVYDEEGKVIHDPYSGRKSLSQGASTTVWCAVSPQLKNIGGVYCENTDIAEIDTSGINPNERVQGKTKICGVMPYAVNSVNAERLWDLSEKLTRVNFNI